MSRLKQGQEVWVPGQKDWVWEMATIESVQSRDEVVVVTQSNRQFLTNLAFLPNPIVLGGYSDLTSMPHLSEPTILSNLHRRSLEARPYTFMGSVLVTVNPLNAPKTEVKPVQLKAGHPSVLNTPHPYAVAETALQQLQFGMAQRRRHAKTGGDPAELETPVAQTILVSGESGAGKTRASNMVLRHLVERCGGSNVVQVLPSSATVLEAFGNAGTLRNDDSSRYGNLLKLHFDSQGKAIVGGSIVTYLLERNRITTHREGERPYHIFLRLLAALSKDKTLGLGGGKDRQASLGLNPKGVYRYLAPGAHKAASLSAVTAKPAFDASKDAKMFTETREAFRALAFSDEDIHQVLLVLAGVLHIGNMDFVDDDRPEGFVAEVDRSQSSQTALDEAVRVLGFLDRAAFVRLFCERQIKSGNSAAITVFNEAKQAREAADAVARAMYARLFAWLLERINDTIARVGERDGAGEEATSAEDFSSAVIGVLDLFGFESFQRNGFEQLLINYANEALQATFNQQIFHAEVELYRREQLVLDGGAQLRLPKGNSACMALLESASSKNPGILEVIEQQGKMPQPSDQKLNDKLHSLFGGKSPSFGKVHPKDIDRHFVVLHYAGPVKYTVGSFLSKNSDALPQAVDDFFESSGHELLPSIWRCTGVESLEGGAGKKPKKGSVVNKFRAQIVELKAYLDATRCSFIRCVKPNPFLECKVGSGVEWFNRRYVTTQLKALSVLQTAEVLKNGFPTRVAYDDLTETYAGILPPAALAAWRGIGGGSETAFVAALFWAFEIPADAYKLGLTRVFFRSGKLAELDGVLNAAADWASGAGGADAQARVASRFQLYFLRRRWRVVFAKLFAFRHFHALLRGSADRDAAARAVQRWWRSAIAVATLRRTVRAALLMQRVARVKAARKELRRRQKARAAEVAKRERALQEQLRKEEEDRQRLEKQRQEKLRELERLEAEQKRAAAQRAEEARKADALAKAEAMLVNVKKNNAKREARMRQQLEHLEEMSAFTFGGETIEETPDDEDDDDDDAQDAGAAAELGDGDGGAQGESAAPAERKKSIMSRPRGRSSRVKSQASSASAIERKKARERERVARARVAAARRIQELQDAEDLFMQDLQRARHDAQTLDKQIESADKAMAETRHEYEDVKRERAEQHRKREARRMLQAQQLDDAGEHFAEQQRFVPGRPRKSVTANRKLGMRFFKADLRRRQRRRNKPVRKSYVPEEGVQQVLSESDISDEDPDDDDDDDGALQQGYGATAAGPARSLEAEGHKLPVRGGGLLGSLLGRRWKPHDFVLDAKDLAISYFHKGGKVRERFHLNDKMSAEPSVVSVNPPEYAEKPNVLRIVGGFLSADLSTRDQRKRRQVLVVSLRSADDLELWIDALWEYIAPADALRLEESHQLRSRHGGAPAGRKRHAAGRRSTHVAAAGDGAGDDGDDVDPLLDLDPAQRQAVNEWLYRAKLLKKQGKSEEEVSRLLMNPLLVKRDKNGNVVRDDADDEEDDDNVDAGTKNIMCPSCRKPSAVAFDEENCPQCGAELPDDDDD